jgi:autotransporter-associated beta strand protein
MREEMSSRTLRRIARPTPLLITASLLILPTGIDAQINITTQQSVANPAAADALVDPAGIVVSTATGQLRITGMGVFTFGDNPSQLINLSGGNPSGGALLARRQDTTVVNPFLISADSVIHVEGASSVLNLTGQISGSGALEKIGGGTLALTANNPFSGSITLQNGTLQLSNLNAISSASGIQAGSGTAIQLNVTGLNAWQLGTGNIVLNNGGTLRQFSGSDEDIALISQTIQLTGTGGTLNAPGDSRIYAQGDITGSGALTKAGGGELRFTNSPKTYTGATNVNNGRLRIDRDGIPIATSAINLGGGNLRFGQSGNFTFSLGAGGNAPVNITGSSSIEHTDLGHITLTNPISRTGGGTGNFRSRDDGALLELSGTLTGGGALNINQGTGGNPVQAGTIFLSGNASAFSGNINVLQSTLRLGQNTTLGANAFTLQAPATLMLDLASPSDFGRVSATSATLSSGSTIATNFLSGPDGGITTYDIINTTSGVTNNGALVQSTGLMQLSLNTTNPNILQLVADVDYSGGGLLGFNQIETAVSEYLNAPGTGTALSAMRGGALNSTTDAEIAALYNAIAAEEYAGTIDTALYGAQSQLRSITRFAPHLQNRLGLADSLGVRPHEPGAAGGDLAYSNWNVFSDLLIQGNDRARSTELGGYNASGQTLILGADRLFSDQFAAGFFGSYEHSRIEFDQRRGWSNGDTFGVGAMASWLLPKSQVTLGVQQLRHNFEVERYSPLGTARSRPKGDQTGIILQGSTQWGHGRFSVIPTAHLQYNRLSLGGFTESGSPIAQSFDSRSYDSLQGGLGVRIGYDIPGHSVALRPEVFAEYRHEFLDASRSLNSSFLDGSGPLSITAPDRSSGYAVVGGGLHADFSGNASAFVQYEAQLVESNATNYGIYGGMRWTFGESLLDNSVLAFSETNTRYRDSLRRSPLGDAIDFFNLRALVMLQYDHANTKASAGTDPDPDDPADTDFWFARRVRLSADRDLGMGFNLGAAWQYSENLDSNENSIDLFRANLGWELYEPFTLHFGLDKVPLGWEETTSSATIRTVERSVATRTFNRLGGDDIGRSHWRAAASGRFREIYTNSAGPVNRYDFHYEFAVANPREAVHAPWRDDANPLVERWPKPSFYLRLHNELHTSIGLFDFGVDLADIPSFRARSDNMVTGAKAMSPFLNYNRGWFNLSTVGMMARYDRDQLNGGNRVNPTGFTITPSIFVTPQTELVAMYSRFDTDGDFAIRLNQSSPNLPTTYPDNRRFNEIEQFYFGVNHYLNGDDLKVMYGIEHTSASGAAANRPVSKEESWAFRLRLQLRL